MTSPQEDLQEQIRGHTELVRPPLVPELRLHLVTPRCPLWCATEAQLAQLGLEAPYWAFAWAGGQALARLIYDRPALARGRRVVDLGAGGGVEALAAAAVGAASVLAADIDPWAVACAQLNAAENSLSIDCTAEDLIGSRLEAELLLLGDVSYGEALTARILSWAQAEARRGVEVLIADPGRGFLFADGLEELACYEAPADVDPGGVYTQRTWVYRLRG